MAWEGDGGSNRLRVKLWDPDRPCYCDKKAAEEAYFHFLADPMYFIEQYVNPNLQGKEYADLNVFATYSTLGTEGGISSADQLIWNETVEIFGIDAADALYDAQIKNIQASWTDDKTVTAGGVLAAVIFGHVGNPGMPVPPIDPLTYDYANPPASGWTWAGDSVKGQWYNSATEESLRIDLTHHGELHYDIRSADGVNYRLFPGGGIEIKPK